MKEIKRFTLIFMLVCIIMSIFLVRGMLIIIDELIALIILCSSLILPILVCLVYIRGEIDELRLRKMIRIIQICMVYQILIVPIALAVTLNELILNEITIIDRVWSVFPAFAAISSIYLLIGAKMQYKNLIELNNDSKQ